MLSLVVHVLVAWVVTALVLGVAFGGFVLITTLDKDFGITGILVPCLFLVTGIAGVLVWDNKRG